MLISFFSKYKCARFCKKARTIRGRLNVGEKTRKRAVKNSSNWKYRFHKNITHKKNNTTIYSQKYNHTYSQTATAAQSSSSRDFSPNLFITLARREPWIAIKLTFVHQNLLLRAGKQWIWVLQNSLCNLLTSKWTLKCAENENI